MKTLLLIDEQPLYSTEVVRSPRIGGIFTFTTCQGENKRFYITELFKNNNSTTAHGHLIK